MKTDNALAKSSIFSEMLNGGDTGRGRVEHRNFLQWWFTHYNGNRLETFLGTSGKRVVAAGRADRLPRSRPHGTSGASNPVEDETQPR